MAMTMKKGNTGGGLLLVCALVVAFAAVTEAAGKLSPANCMAECMSICPEDNNDPCQVKCKGMCEALKAIHEEAMGGNAGGHDKHAKTAHNEKQTGSKATHEEGRGGAGEKLSPANCMPECMSICPKDNNNPCQEKCKGMCEVLKAIHEEAMGGNAEGHDKHAKTAHNEKQPGSKTAEGDSEHAFCKSECMPTCASMRLKRPDIKCDVECQEYCKAAVKYLEAKTKSKN